MVRDPLSSDYWAAVEEAAEEVAAAEDVPAVELAFPPLQAAMVKAMARAIIPAITFFILIFSFTFDLICRAGQKACFARFLITVLSLALIYYKTALHFFTASLLLPAKI